MSDKEKDEARLELLSAACNYALMVSNENDCADDDRMVSVIARLENAAKAFAEFDGEWICKKCGLRQEGEKPEPTF